MVTLRHGQRQLWEGFFAEEAQQWMEAWMRRADELLEDEALLDSVYEAQGRRRPKSRQRGRKQTPAEVALRLAVLKHVRNWSFEETEREVRANVVYRQFTRIGAEKVPDAKTMGRLVQALGPEVVQQIHQRLVEVAQEKKVVRGRKLRVDTTVVETNIHYPTDSGLLGDGARVLTRTMKKITALTTKAGTRLRDRMRSIGRRVMDIARTSRSKGPQVQEKMKQSYRRLLTATRQVVNQAKRFRAEIASGVKRAAERNQKAVLQVLRKELETMLPRVQQVIRQTKARVLGGDVHAPGKLVSVFEPSTEVIRKGKASKPNEFGKMVKIQEAENQIITGYQVYAERPSDSDLLVAAVEAHQQQLGRVPDLVAADAGFFSAQNERDVQEMGVKRVSVPSRNTKSAERRQLQKKRWFRKGQKWRTGCEGRISLLKRRHGLNRCRYRGDAGMHRWVGLGVIADNLINIGRCLASQDTG
ncbi:MAG: ISNCY family transposase [Polaromonas sp.]